MSLRDINHQIAIELGQCDTEFVTGLKDEREQLLRELECLRLDSSTATSCIRIVEVSRRLARIEELLAHENT